MKRTIALSLAVLGLSILPIEVSAKDKHDRDRYEYSHDKKHHHKPSRKYKKHNRDNYFRKLPSGLYQRVSYGNLSPSWYKKYHHGDILDREIYRRGKVVKRLNHKGVVTIEVDDRFIHLIHDTREILSIVSRHH